MDKFLNATKSWIAGLGAALIVAIISYAEQSFGISTDTNMKATVSAHVSAAIMSQLVYWLPNRPLP